MKIAFIAAAGIPVYGKIIEERPTGGTETAVVRLAEELSYKNHEVFVVTNHPNPPVSKPLYVPLSASGNLPELDCVVTVRDWRLIFNKIRAKKRFLWIPDAVDQPITFGIGDKRIWNNLHAVLTVSEWQKKTFVEVAGVPEEKIKILRNGVHLPYFEGSEEKKKNSMFYSSTPYRGLSHLIEIFPEIKKQVPDAQLNIYSGFKVYEGSGLVPQSASDDLKKIEDAFQKIDAAFLKGNMHQKVLSREMMKSELLVYPNTFPETSCITAMEAKAAGCIVVTSYKGALPETLGKNGILIKGEPGTKDYSKSFIDSTVQILTNRLELQRISEENKREIFSSGGWSHRAEEFLKFL